ncbi:bile acid:sodium symporter family protein [Rhodobium gokarnense]|uniref:BASS family bile acid:Na+ symporter n=1 Tax=Rhodobium gokarnense TaxID=364296 RepID=A0ABT3HBH9_9HYPH|nr:bile acid:sodium symporter family protein [Rhodobium gokarnense]MCW2307747.1 BASS family bile acid:Na+ symporter [Rhodobium gokarnense]
MTANILLPAGLFVIMTVVGLGMRPIDFARLADGKRALVFGLAAQILGLPLIAFGIAHGLGLSPEMAVGLVILAASPGGVTSNFLTMLARGDVALSIAMTAVTSALSLITVPLVVGFGLAYFLGTAETISMPLGRTIGSIVVVTALPLVIGMTIRARAPGFVRRNLGLARRLATLIFALIVAWTFWVERDSISTYWAEVGPAVIALNVLAIGLGFGLAALLRLQARRAIAIAVECGLQNVALAMFIAFVLLQTPLLSVPAIIYAIAMNLSVVAVIAIGRKTLAEEDPLALEKEA